MTRNDTNQRKSGHRDADTMSALCDKLESNLLTLDHMRSADPDRFIRFRSECLLGTGFAAGFIAGLPRMRSGMLWRTLTLLG